MGVSKKHRKLTCVRVCGRNLWEAHTQQAAVGGKVKQRAANTKNPELIHDCVCVRVCVCVLGGVLQA